MQQVLFQKLRCVVRPLRGGVAEILEVFKENYNLIETTCKGRIEGVAYRGKFQSKNAQGRGE